MATQADLNPDTLLQQAWSAYQQGQWAEALASFALCLLLKPEEPQAYNGAGQALRQLGMVPAAEDVLERGAKRFPENEAIGVTWGWLALPQARFSEAVQRFEAVRAHHPNSGGAWHGLSVSLLECGRLEEAEAVILSRPLPEGPWGSGMLGLLIRTATGLGKLELALERSQALVAREPDTPRYHTQVIDALRTLGRREAMEAAVQTALDRFGDNLELMTAMARSATEVEDWRNALARWEAVKTLFPAVPEGYLGCAQALRAMDRPEDADLVVGPALRLFPGHLELMRCSAEVADECLRWDEAQKRWQALQALQPGVPSVWIGEVQTLLTAGRHEQAQALSTRLQERFSNDVWVASLDAQVAVTSKDLVLAEARWREVLRRFPSSGYVLVGLADCLTNAAKVDQAEALIAEATKAMPEAVDVAVAHARMPMHWNEWELSELRWKELLARLPQCVPALLGYASLLSLLGRQDEAVAVLNSPEIGPSARFILDIELARLAVQLRQWQRAFDLLVALKSRRPWNRAVRALVSDALWHVNQEQAVDPTAVPEVPELLLRTDDDEAKERQAKRKLMMKFESLGDSCEFGIVQRRFGAEPLGLLRWTGAPPEGLAAALRLQLAGIGDPEFTELKVAPQGSEYVIWDQRFHMFSHTFTPSFSMPRDKFYDAHCRRMRFMRTKLLNDIANSEKVYVYASARLNDQNIAELHEAIRSLGQQAILLCVRKADEQHPAGQVRQLADGLLVGAISRHSTVNIEINEWLEVCRAALSLVGRNDPA